MQVAISPDIHDEYERVVARFEEAFPDVQLSELLAVLVVGAEWCRPGALDERVSADPADDKFLACAVSSGATVVISGDKHLPRVSGYRNIEVLTPRAFVDRCT